MFEAYARKPVRRLIGLMSGTSVDGIDAALIELGEKDGEISVRLADFTNFPYPDAVRQQIFELFDPKTSTVDKIGFMNFLLGELFAAAALSLIEKAGLKPSDVDAIGSHGQTIYHAPEPVLCEGYPVRYTVQIGEGAVISARTGIPCVSDFRTADMAAGGQGAPLVPFTEYLLYRKKDKSVLLQNIGGIGNITVLPANCSPEEVFAFDTGPGNMIMDGLVSRLYDGRFSMDTGGTIAASGIIQAELLNFFTQNEYYRLPPPKSTGRELFGAQYVEHTLRFAQSKGFCREDTIATATYLTAWSIADAYRHFIKKRCKSDYIVIGGGGSYNPTLVAHIRSEMAALNVGTFVQEDLGLNSDAKEAVAFALLADHTLMGKANNLPSVTGASRPTVMGKVSL